MISSIKSSHVSTVSGLKSLHTGRAWKDPKFVDKYAEMETSVMSLSAAGTVDLVYDRGHADGPEFPTAPA